MAIKTYKLLLQSITVVMMLCFVQSCCSTNAKDATVAHASVSLRELPMHNYIETHCRKLFGSKPPKAWQDYVKFCNEVNEIMSSADDSADESCGQPILPAAETLWTTISDQEYKEYFAVLLQCMALPGLTAKQKANLEELALIHRQEWLLSQLFHTHNVMLHGARNSIVNFMMCASFYHVFRQNTGALAAEHAGYDKLDADLEEWYALWRERKLMPASAQLPVLWKCSNGKQEVVFRFAPVYNDTPSAMLFTEDTKSYVMTCEMEMQIDADGLYLIFPAMPAEYNITVNGQNVTPPQIAHPFAYLLNDNASFIRITITTTTLDSIGRPTLPICIAKAGAQQ